MNQEAVKYLEKTREIRETKPPEISSNLQSTDKLPSFFYLKGSEYKNC